jgi:hypothetical protein
MLKYNARKGWLFLFLILTTLLFYTNYDFSAIQAISDHQLHHIRRPLINNYIDVGKSEKTIQDVEILKAEIQFLSNLMVNHTNETLSANLSDIDQLGNILQQTKQVQQRFRKRIKYNKYCIHRNLK